MMCRHRLPGPILFGLMLGLVLLVPVVFAAQVRLDGLRVLHVYHGTVWIFWEHEGRTREIAVDPWSKANIPADRKADLVLVTDIHYDHNDPETIARIAKPDTVVIAPPAVARESQARLPRLQWRILKNGETTTWSGVTIRAIPMYNTSPDRMQYHPKGRGNGYLLVFGEFRVYIAGDTQCTPEMRALKDITVALIPINLPYTMDADEAAECVKAFRPRLVIPYHYDVGEANPKRFRDLLANEMDIQVVMGRN